MRSRSESMRTAARSTCSTISMAALYVYFNVVGSYAFEGDRPEVEIRIDYYDAGNAILRLQYDSFSAPYTTHPDVVQLTNTNTWKQKTWTVPDAFFRNRQNGGSDFRIHRLGEGPSTWT